MDEVQKHNSFNTVPFAVLAPGGQSGNFWIQPTKRSLLLQTLKVSGSRNFPHFIDLEGSLL
jgi:hypothetical protein